VLWNSVPHDWDDPEHWVERCLADVGHQDWTVVVLRDIENAALARLPELLDRLGQAGVEIVQDFPDHVVLTRGGATASLTPEHVAGRLARMKL
jgi:hypothetical protein